MLLYIKATHTKRGVRERTRNYLVQFASVWPLKPFDGQKKLRIPYTCTGSSWLDIVVGCWFHDDSFYTQYNLYIPLLLFLRHWWLVLSFFRYPQTITCNSIKQFLVVVCSWLLLLIIGYHPTTACSACDGLWSKQRQRTWPQHGRWDLCVHLIHGSMYTSWHWCIYMYLHSEDPTSLPAGVILDFFRDLWHWTLAL